MQNDTNTYGYNQWFYFSLQNIKKDTPYTFNIANFVLLPIGRKSHTPSGTRGSNRAYFHSPGHNSQATAGTELEQTCPTDHLILPSNNVHHITLSHFNWFSIMTTTM